MLYSNLLEKLFLPVGDALYRTDVMKQLKLWRKISNYSEDELEALSDYNLGNLLEYASTNIPFYKKFNSRLEHDNKEWLKVFPIMRKADVKGNIKDLVKGDINKLIRYESSGSSGIQGVVYMNKREEALLRALLLLWWEWSGYYFGKPVLQTGMTPNRGFTKSIKDFLFRTKYIQAFNLEDSLIIEALNRVRNQRGIHLAGYASSLNVLADAAIQYKIRDVNFDSAICWGDKLFDHYKRKIQEAFGCYVYETYSSNEGFLVGSKKDLDYFYIMSPHVYLELVDKNGNPVPDGEMGYVILTRLDCYTMPLIRYYVGDLAVKLPKEKYPRKRDMAFPLLERVIGRDTDIVVTKGGKKLIVHFFTGIFEFIPEIIQFRVIQKEPGGIEIEFIPDKEFSPTVLNRIENTIYDKIHESIKIQWKKVDHIPPTSSGKPQLIQSFIAKDY